MTDAQALQFARSIRSIWTLEILLCLHRTAPRLWQPDELVRELRASPSIVLAGIELLSRAGVVGEDDGRIRYAPANGERDELVQALAALYRARPAAVSAAIFASDDPVRQFSDAFRIRKPDS